jgi:hypothetical protein
VAAPAPHHHGKSSLGQAVGNAARHPAQRRRRGHVARDRRLPPGRPAGPSDPLRQRHDAADGLPQQLADLRSAVDPVYAALRRDASSKKWLDQIQALKDQLHAPETASCAGLGASQPASPIDGTCWRRAGRADVLAACHGTLPPGAESTPAHNTLEVVFDHGSVTQYEQPDGGTKEPGWRGTYQTFRDTLELTEYGTTATFTVTWSLNGSTLTLSNLRNGDNCLDVATWTGSWTKRK